MRETIVDYNVHRNAELTPPGSPPQYKAYLRPNWFIQRENGAYVPVIAVDELPAEIELEGAPRSLNVDDAQGMRFLEKLPYNGQRYTLVTQFSTPDAWIRKAQQPYTDSQTSLRPFRLSSSPIPPSTRGAPEPELRTPSRHALEKTQSKDTLSAIDAIKADLETAAHIGYTGPKQLPPSGKEPDQARKEYCTYWIKFGECDFTQQGCLYKHEMPDLKTLRTVVGINSVPRWWQEKTAIRLHRGDGKGDGDMNSRAPLQSPTWLQQRINVADKERAASEDEEDEESDEEGEVDTTLPSSSVANKAVVPVRMAFKAPDALRRGEYQKTAATVSPVSERVAGGSDARAAAAPRSRITELADAEEQHLMDISTPTAYPNISATAHQSAVKTTNSPSPGTVTRANTLSRRGIFVPAGESLPRSVSTTPTSTRRRPASAIVATTHEQAQVPTRRISDKQAEIFELIRAGSAPPLPNLEGRDPHSMNAVQRQEHTHGHSATHHRVSSISAELPPPQTASKTRAATPRHRVSTAGFTHYFHSPAPGQSGHQHELPPAQQQHEDYEIIHVGNGDEDEEQESPGLSHESPDIVGTANRISVSNTRAGARSRAAMHLPSPTAETAASGTGFPRPTTDPCSSSRPRASTTTTSSTAPKGLTSLLSSKHAPTHIRSQASNPETGSVPSFEPHTVITGGLRGDALGMDRDAGTGAANTTAQGRVVGMKRVTVGGSGGQAKAVRATRVMEDQGKGRSVGGCISMRVKATRMPVKVVGGKKAVAA